MSRILKDLDDLLSQGIITPETADRIRNYYEKPKSGVSRMVIAFGVVGALLVGLGIVMILAHNWDNFTNPVKLAIGLLPMLVTQVTCGVLIIKDISSSAWREAAAVLLIFAVATAISIVGQVYNIPGSLESFLLTWVILCIPVPYLLKSKMASLLCWAGATWYATYVGYGFSHTKAPLYFWLMVAALMPYYINLLRRWPQSNGVTIHNWFIAISLGVTLAITNFGADDLLIPAYISMFSLFVLVGQLPQFANRKLMTNGWLVVGSGAMIILLLFLTFEWPELENRSLSWWISPELFIWIALFSAATFILIVLGKANGYRNVLSKSYAHIVFVPVLLIGIYNPVLARILTNVLILVLGVYTIREGAMANKLWQMNYGMLILSILIICRFFDTEMSFVIRGLLFVGIGLGFFAMNFYMMQRRKTVTAP